MVMLTNNTGIPLALAVWLAADEYDHVSNPDYISATTIMRPVRQIVLGRRASQLGLEDDIESKIASRMGTALHDSVEKAWTLSHAKALAAMGFSQDVIDAVRINPTDDELKSTPGIIPIYLEQRVTKKIGSMFVGGKYDAIIEGILHDLKTTSAYSWLSDDKDDDYAMQGSIYRWLNPDKITSDFIRICFIFTDWQKAQALSNPKYPSKRAEHKDVKLHSVSHTETILRKKVEAIRLYENADETDIPECAEEDLWMTPATYKYYSDPNKTTGRSTKNFDSFYEANLFHREKGKGIVIISPGIPRRCNYCQAFTICSQRLKYFPED